MDSKHKQYLINRLIENRLDAAKCLEDFMSLSTTVWRIYGGDLNNFEKATPELFDRFCTVGYNLIKPIGAERGKHRLVKYKTINGKY